jgi:hypothetical protein
LENRWPLISIGILVTICNYMRNASQNLLLLHFGEVEESGSGMPDLVEGTNRIGKPVSSRPMM